MHVKMLPSIAARAAAGLLLLHCASVSLADAIDDYIRSEMERQRIPGLALAVVLDGKPVKMQGYGLANVELDTPVGTDTVFRISSISKQFIATAVMLQTICSIHCIRTSVESRSKSRSASRPICG